MSENQAPRGPFYQEGKYRCRIDEQALGVASTGNPQVIIRFTVLAVYSGGNLNDLSQQYQRTYFGTITDNTIEYIKADLDALGLFVTSFGQIDQNRKGFVDVRGTEVDMICAHEDDGKGALRERWRVARSAGNKPLEYKPVESSAVSKLDALFGSVLKSNAGKRQQPAPTAVATQNGGSVAVDDNDIPF